MLASPPRRATKEAARLLLLPSGPTAISAVAVPVAAVSALAVPAAAVSALAVSAAAGSAVIVTAAVMVAKAPVGEGQGQ